MLVLLADAHLDWRPESYEEQLWGCRLRFEYPTCKLLDLAGEPGSLDKSDNPVAVVIAARLAAQATADDLTARHEFKWALIRHPSSVLCLLMSILCPLSSVLCPLSSVLRPLSSVLCPLSSVLCPLSSVLCPLPEAGFQLLMR